MRIRCYSKLPICLGAAVLLLAIGLAVEGQMAQPRLKQLYALNDEKAQLNHKLQQQRNIESDTREVAALLGLESLSDLESLTSGDPIAYLSRLLDESGLVRLSLTASGREPVGSLDKQTYTVRAQGNYRSMQRFIQKVEGGPCLASIDILKIMPDMNGQKLEGRFGLSLYNLGGQP